ncbi:MAG: AsmA family protein [Candidatus Omnitrophota bacterium]
MVKKRLLTLVVLVSILAAAIGFTKNIIAKTAITQGVKVITGLKLDINRMNVGVINSLIDITDVKLFNPPEFKDALMIDMPEIYVEYDLGAFLNKKVHLKEVRLNLKEFMVVKNEQGQLNIDSLRAVQTAKAKKAAPKKEVKKEKPQIQIDVLLLKVGKVVYKDYARGAPKVMEFNVNIDQRYENITDPEVLGQLIIAKALMNTTIANLTNYDLGVLTVGLTDTLKDTGKGITDTAVNVLSGAGDIGGEVAETAKETLKKILPLGK